MTSSQPIVWLFARPIAGFLSLALGIALLRAALTGRLGRIPVLERLVGQGIRPKVRRKRFLTRVELEALNYLEASCPQLREHCQVSMGALIAPERWLGRNDARWMHRLYAQKIVDYVLQDRCTGEIVALVELDDWTHQRRRDGARDVLTAAAGYQTIRLPAWQRPTLASVRETIFNALG